MSSKAHIDFETYSECDLLKSGGDVYSLHKTTDINCLCYAIGDGAVQLWVPGDPVPRDLMDHVLAGKTVIAHNMGGFEILLWNNVCVPRYDFAPLSLNQCEDTVPMCFAMGIPGHLEGAASALGLKFKKDMTGHRVMLQLCKPRAKGVRYTPKTAPEKFEQLYEYCKRDVEVERELYSRLRPLSEKERRVWVLDQKINRRGIKVDKKSAKAFLKIIEAEKARLDEKIQKASGGFISSTGAVGCISQYLEHHGYETDTVDKSYVTGMLEDESLPENVRDVLQIRADASKTSTAKIKAMLSGIGVDDRMRGLFQYHGASTGRWAGRRVQLQNLPRSSSLSRDDIAKVFEIINDVSDVENATFLIDLEFGPVLDVISQCVRGLLIPEFEHEFVAVDFSAIEARVLAWLSGEEKILKEFRGEGKVYELAASAIYKIPIEKVTKEQRQIGKVAVLALGYGGGAGAFQMMANAYGIEISKELADEIKTAWREANTNTVSFWHALEKTALEAVALQGRRPVKCYGLTFKVVGSFLWVKLPSGRIIRYPYPSIEDVETPWGELKPALHYFTVNSMTKKWEKTKTYGGKLAENVTQAVARDLLADAMLQLEDAGIVAHVHDEIVIETKSISLEQVEKIMSTPPKWGPDIPLSAEGWVGERYRK